MLVLDEYHQKTCECSFCQRDLKPFLWIPPLKAKTSWTTLAMPWRGGRRYIRVCGLWSWVPWFDTHVALVVWRKDWKAVYIHFLPGRCWRVFPWRVAQIPHCECKKEYNKA